MTFVDVVFPAFLFIAGMSIPFALGGRLDRGEAVWKTMLHVLVRTGSLLLLGILMVNESPDSSVMGWSGALWSTLMFLSAILAFSSIRSPAHGATPGHSPRYASLVSLGLRGAGFVVLVYLAFAFRGEGGRRIITLSPFSLHTSWYGILGLIGWAYLIASLAFVLFRTQRTALLGVIVLLFCLYAADRKGAFENFWLARYVGLGEALGSLAAITLAGALLATILLTPDTATHSARATFTLLFIAGCAAGAMLLHRLYGISKNNATPPWCLWSCAISAALWLAFYFLADVRPESRAARLARPFALAGGNVLLAYLLSEMLPSLLEVLRLDDWYAGLAQSNLAGAITRSAACAALLLAVTALLNRLGFRLKL